MTAVPGTPVILARCRDGSLRVFAWRNRGTGGGAADWRALGAIVDENRARTGGANWEIVSLQGALIESPDHGGGERIEGRS